MQTVAWTQKEIGLLISSGAASAFSSEYNINVILNLKFKMYEKKFTKREREKQITYLHEYFCLFFLFCTKNTSAFVKECSKSSKIYSNQKIQCLNVLTSYKWPPFFKELQWPMNQKKYKDNYFNQTLQILHLLTPGQEERKWGRRHTWWIFFFNQTSSSCLHLTLYWMIHNYRIKPRLLVCWN